MLAAPSVTSFYLYFLMLAGQVVTFVTAMMRPASGRFTDKCYPSVGGVLDSTVPSPHNCCSSPSRLLFACSTSCVTSKNVVGSNVCMSSLGVCVCVCVSSVKCGVPPFD